ncbi:hypothetical protein L1X38_18170, partial [Acinetobacter baumannii]|nr:hypothetical protein [Acinetobacter baumannii]
MPASTSQYYTRTAQILHWIMAIIFITAWVIGFYSGNFRHCCKVSDEAAFCLIQRPYISKTLLT